MQKADGKFKVRSFVTLMIALSGIGLPITGIANHIYGLIPLTVERHAWMAAHNALGVVFIVFAIWHIALNRHVLSNHIKTVFAIRPAFRREALLACIIFALIFLFVSHAFHLPGGELQNGRPQSRSGFNGDS